MAMKFLKKFAPLAGLLLAVTVRAQPATPPPPQNLSAADMRVQVEAFKKQIDGDYRHVLHLQAITRKDKDVIKLTCVNDKLVNVKAQMDLADAAALQVDAAITGNDEALRTSSFADVEHAASAIKTLRSEADGCVGELEMYKQESNLDVQRPPDLDDPTDTGDGFDGYTHPDIEVPGYATPYK